jgi:predicted DNA-binding protein
MALKTYAFNLEVEQRERLERLSKETDRSVSYLLRHAIEMLFEKYEEEKING